ncbi:MAG: HAD family hydrolase [Lachnospiraceae bacterium]|nr:HAD family hydrolase [Lachnospiraceae bacterium]
MITTILFDLDGTLLPMNQELFVKAYFKLLLERLLPLGYEKDKFIQTIMAGMEAMVRNDGTVKNEVVFWKVFEEMMGKEALEHRPLIDDFYVNDFNKASFTCPRNEKVAGYFNQVKEMGFRVVLATNPIFPAPATENRIRWAGLKPEDFELYTTYENSSYCKPNPKYYQEILDKIGCKAEECLMVGNDVTEDMVAKTLGMKVFLHKDCLINKEEQDISEYPQGGFEELMDFLKGLK